MGLVLVFHGAVFIWQVTGVLRASKVFFSEGGQTHVIWGAKLILVLSAYWVLAYSLEAWQLTRNNENPFPSDDAMRTARAGKYSITIPDSSQSLSFSGSIELGATDQVRQHLSAHPAITEIVLNSKGGNIYEARGLAALIREGDLGTAAHGTCNSACTTVFIAGTSRRIMPGARLGFHKYRIDAGYAVLTADPRREQDYDLAAFRRSGVAEWFLEKVYENDATGMWYPTTRELIDAGVVTPAAP